MSAESNTAVSAVANPYAPPQAAVIDAPAADDAVGVVRPFSPRGRIGRVRYLAYGIGATLLVAMIGALAGFLSAAMGMPMLGGILIVLGYAGFLIFHAILAIQRSHDFDQSGWLALLAFVPLANLAFLLIPGSRGSNRFGPKPPPNGKAGTFAVVALLAVFVIGIVAAIAIPAYNDYLHRARAVKVQGGF
ncbi:DUF805 domain-containing protein [Niveibacterium sp.]|uniref:DUF805 domain-containing protein n=1 Tax=Niveibacterium sp. TaxID=2017444 RepID=UPI0035B199AC